MTGAMQLALGVMTALLARERYGMGQRVHTSAYGGQLWLQQWELTHGSITGQALERVGAYHPNIQAMYGIYETSDGEWIFFGVPMTNESWDAFCVFAELPELAIDPHWDQPAKRLGLGAEAKELNRKLVEGKVVILETDVSETDRYGRSLRYVFCPTRRAGPHFS